MTIGPVREERESAANSAGPGTRGEMELLLPLVAAICVVIGWLVVLDYERTALELVSQAPVLMQRVWYLRLMMSFLSVGALGLCLVSLRDGRRRRAAEQELERVNADLARRVVRRTAELRARTKALREARLREELREKEAEVAFQAGLVEAAGHYLHGVGNALSSLEVELLRLGKTLDGAKRFQAAFDALAEAVEAGRAEEAGSRLAALREAVCGRAFPRLDASRAALADIKERMADELERRRGEFERRGQPVQYFQSVRVDLELAGLLDRLPRVPGDEPIRCDVGLPVTVCTRKHPLLTGLDALLRQALEMAPGPLAVRLEQGADGRAVVTVEGSGAMDMTEPAVSAFVNFLNENNGMFRFEATGEDRPLRLVVEIGNAAPACSLS